MTDTRVPDAKIEELLALLDKATAGDWSIPHFATDDVDCPCRYVLSEGYAGSVCDISVENGLRIGEGGNDAPPLEEARANARLIPTSRNNLKLILLELRERRAADRNPLVNPMRGDELQCRDDRVLIEFADDKTVSYRYRSPGNESWSPIHSAMLNTYRGWPTTSVIRRAAIGTHAQKEGE